MATLLRGAVIVMTALFLQLGLFTEVRVAGVAPDLLLLATVAAAMTGGANTGATVGFAAGLLIDLWIPTPLGMSALAYALTGFGTGVLIDSGIRAEGLLAAGYATVASAAGVGLFASIAGLTGQPGVWTADLVRIIVVSALLNGALSPLAMMGARWAHRVPDPRAPHAVRMLN